MAGKEPHDPQFATPEFYARYRAGEIPLPKAFAPFQPFDNDWMTGRDEMTLAWPRTPQSITGKLARYYASISYWDHEVGRVVQALRDAGQFDNTVFVVAGDNGLSLGQHGLLGKQNLYHFGGMHVPLIFAGRGIPKGESRALAYLMDVFPTVCELAGLPAPGRVEGLSLAPVLRAEKTQVRDWLYTAFGTGQRAVTDGRWKLIRYPRIDKTQLFDPKSDSLEERDLAAVPDHAGRVEPLMAKLAELQRQWGDPHPLKVDRPRPADWSPERLTQEQIKAQEDETARSAGQKPAPRAGKAKKTAKKTRPGKRS